MSQQLMQQEDLNLNIVNSYQQSKNKFPNLNSQKIQYYNNKCDNYHYNNQIPQIQNQNQQSERQLNKNQFFNQSIFSFDDNFSDQIHDYYDDYFEDKNQIQIDKNLDHSQLLTTSGDENKSNIKYKNFQFGLQNIKQEYHYNKKNKKKFLTSFVIHKKSTIRNTMIVEYEQEDLGYQPASIPSNINLAISHKKANKLGIPTNYQKVCNCCIKPVFKKKFKFWRSNPLLARYGSGLPVYFYVIIQNVIICILVFLINSIYVQLKEDLICQQFKDECFSYALGLKVLYPKFLDDKKNPQFFIYDKPVKIKKAPEPDDIIWENFGIPPGKKLVSRIIEFILHITFLAVCTATFMGLYEFQNYLKNTYPELNDIYNIYDLIMSFFFSSAIMMFIFAGKLVIFKLTMLRYYQTYSQRDSNLMTKYLFFNMSASIICNSLLV
ncbi:hypothetical protein PPERSA_10599 [Pseudocohnilembus persalinus]|uniref:Transmembrane protein n=1 Tax=Pseudocohnilembus persalinus TaxID=266149 RepID=A0A0V0Q9B3_PSEPJ|nr:hypothetical protein PPERSA_10599 [Pseudocohnilembus persalinus]|eukprot:KRW98828.1 hypothetical protein PPERSA_10599 [Pseudocohnilembus persalinus]